MRKSFFLKLFLATMLFAPLAVMAQVTIGLNEPPEAAALLDLKTQLPDPTTNATTDKGGLLLPRVELIDRYTLEPFIVNASNDEKHSHTGLTVYNVTHNETAGLVSGFFYWNGMMWMEVVSSIPPGSLNMMNLLTNATTIQGASTTDLGTVLNFGTLIIPEDGAYAFNFRLYGNLTSTTIARNYYYIKVLVNGVLSDTAEINLYIVVGSPTSNFYTASVALGTSASAGDVITFRMVHGAVNHGPWQLTAAGANPLGAARTSLVWWKL